MQMQTALDYGELAGLGIALALGLLVGIQRGWAQRQEPAGHRFAGIRTYGLLGFAGGISGTLQHRVPGLAVVLMLATAALVVAGYWRTTQREDTVSGTASLTGLITLTCGFLAGSGEYALASAGTGVTVLVLAMRRRLHH
ncbi:MAG: hypothetical protein RIQ99_1012, partial [Pseudomonadota bacterium]